MHSIVFDEVRPVSDARKNLPPGIHQIVSRVVDDINKKLYFGKPVSLAVRDDLARGEFQRMLREPGVFFVAADVVLEKQDQSLGPS